MMRKIYTNCREQVKQVLEDYLKQYTTMMFQYYPNNNFDNKFVYYPFFMRNFPFFCTFFSFVSLQIEKLKATLLLFGLCRLPASRC